MSDDQPTQELQELSARLLRWRIKLEILLSLISLISVTFSALVGIFGFAWTIAFHSMYDINIISYMSVQDFVLMAIAQASRPLISLTMLVLAALILAYFVVSMRNNDMWGPINLPTCVKRIFNIKRQADNWDQYLATFRGKHGWRMVLLILAASFGVVYVWELNWPDEYRAQLTTASGEEFAGRVIAITDENIFFIDDALNEDEETDPNVSILTRSDIRRIEPRNPDSLSGSASSTEVNQD